MSPEVAAPANTKQVVDLCVVVDGTGSMGAYLEALRACAAEFIPSFTLSDNVDRVGVLCYRDYCDGDKLLAWSGWCKADADSLQTNIVPFVNRLVPDGGGDFPEAAKTALVELLGHLDSKETIVLFLTDAPPHLATSAADNAVAERRRLGGSHDDADWVGICRRLAASGARVFTLLNCQDTHTRALYAYLSAQTGGKCLRLEHWEPRDISKCLVCLVLALFGHEADFTGVSQIEVASTQTAITCEADLIANCRVRVSAHVEFPVSETVKKELLAKFKFDASFKDAVYRVFDGLFAGDQVLALSYNKLLGNLWRAVCSDRSREHARARLLEKLSASCNALKAADKTLLKEVIEESYNQEHLVQELISSVSPDLRFPAVVYVGAEFRDTDTLLTAKELLAINRSCDGRSLSTLGTILRSLVVVSSQDQWSSPGGGLSAPAVPLALADRDFFRLVSSLVVRGVVMSTRGAVMMAMVAVLTGTQPLEDRARRFLKTAAGSWLESDKPENYSYDFVKLALKVDDLLLATGPGGEGLLTTEERGRLERLFLLGAWRTNRLTTVTVKTAYTSSKTLRHDRKLRCPKCKTFRSFTLLDPTHKGVCGLCLVDNEGEGEDEAYAKKFRCVDKVKSVMCECFACCAHYAVENVAGLQCRPKCHACRTTGRPGPTLTCTLCSNKFVKGVEAEAACWVCPECAAVGTPSPQETAVTIEQLVATLTTDGGGRSEMHRVFNARSLWSLCEETQGPNVPGVPEVVFIREWEKKPLLNQTEMETAVMQWIHSGKSEQATCMMCFSDNLAKHRVRRVCGLNKACHTLACDKCMGLWYGAARPGCIVNPASLKCPFCREKPHAKILHAFNKTLRDARDLPVSDEAWDLKWYYAWCVGCSRVAPCVAKSCATEAHFDPTAVKTFKCKTCEAAPVTTMACPKCAVLTVKAFGCNHIHCTNRREDGTVCDAHWCFQCGEDCGTAGQVYTHMRDVHGTIGLVDPEQLGEEDDDLHYFEH